MKFSELPPHAQERLRIQYPDLWPRPDPVRAVAAAQSKRAPIQTLVSGVQVTTGCAKGVGFRVQLIALRRRLLDEHDNGPYSFKPLVDAIAASLGLDDGDKRIRWEYHQIKTQGKQGVIVQIERL